MFSKLLDKYISQKKLYFLILFILVLIFLIRNMDISVMLFVSLIFACALNPLVDKLEHKMKRPLAATTVMFGMFALIAIFVVPLICMAICEITDFAKEFPQYIHNINHIIQNLPLLKSLGITNINTASITNTLANSSAGIFESILNFAANASTAFLYVFTSIIILFFLLVDKTRINNAIIKLFPSEYREKTKNIINTVTEKLSGYVFAQTVVSGSVWITMTIGLTVCQIEYAVVLGLIAGVLSIIPVVGSGISLVICWIATYGMGVKALVIVTILYTISHFIENHVVRPYVYSKFLNLHQIIIFLALLIGAKYQGVLGVILAPPFAMALYILLEELYVKKMEE